MKPRRWLELYLELITLENTMNWYHYVACFFAGLFLANTVPHFVKGICGDRFPTPFANRPQKDCPHRW